MFIQILSLLIYTVNASFNGKVIMRIVAETFGRTAHECQAEMNFDSDMLRNIFTYWYDHQHLEDREMGCIFRCVLMKLELVDGDGKLHDDNAKGFFNANGADNVMSKRLIEFYHYCYEAVDQVEDDCMFMLEMGRCCREGVRNAHWSPVSK